MAAGTAAAWAVVAMVVSATDPATASAAVFAIFYACVFLAVAGLLSITGFSARVFILNRRLQISREVAAAFRQAVLLAALAVGALWLQSRGQLNWWTGALMVVIMTLLESFFISARVRR